MSNSNFASPVGGNQYFTGVQQPRVPPRDQSSFRVLDVNVYLSAGVALLGLISLASSGLPNGSVITYVGLNASGSIPDVLTEFQAGYATDPNNPVTFTGAGVAKAAGDGTPGTTVNGGVVQTGLTDLVAALATRFPVVQVSAAAIVATPGARLNVKIGYFPPQV